MNRYSPWRYLLILLVLAVGLIYAAPNLFTPDPALQVTGQSSADEIGQATLDRVREVLDKHDIPYFGEEAEGGRAQVRFPGSEEQLEAQSALQQELGSEYVVALNLAPTTPEWLRGLGAQPMQLGLDLSGGVHFLMQVDSERVVNQYLETNLDEFRRKLRDERIRYRAVDQEERSVVAVFRDREARERASDIARSDFRDFTLETAEDNGRYVLRLTALESEIDQRVDEAVAQNLTALRNRVNELGVSEPVVQRQGKDRIVVELPGIQDTATAKRIIGKTANLEFRLEAESPESPGAEEFEFRDANARPRTAWLEDRVVITGDRVTNATVGYDENGMPQVNITLDSVGGREMNYVTRDNIGRRLGVLFIETRSNLREVVNEVGETEKVLVREEGKEIISLANIRSALGVQFRITGLDSHAEASELALLLRSGALAAPMHFIQERTIGPTLGMANIRMGIESIQVGLLAVVLFMLVIYRVFGVFANIALAMNLVLLVGIMSILGATLTLPGIAGIVLTLGMAVDANVLIFSRIKEEMKKGLSPPAAIQEGYDRAYVSIVDANLTTLIVAVILYAIGSGPIKGFAVVLALGILTSMFTAIVGTRALVNLVYGGPNPRKLWI